MYGSETSIHGDHGDVYVRVGDVIENEEMYVWDTNAKIRVGGGLNLLFRVFPVLCARDCGGFCRDSPSIVSQTSIVSRIPPLWYCR